MDQELNATCEHNSQPSRRILVQDDKVRPSWLTSKTTLSEEFEKSTNVVVIAERSVGKMGTLADQVAALIATGACDRANIKVFSIAPGGPDGFWECVQKRIDQLTVLSVDLDTPPETERMPYEIFEDQSPPIQSEFDANDIELVMGQSGALKRNAIEALRQADGDIVNAIMALTT